MEVWDGNRFKKTSEINIKENEICRLYSSSDKTLHRRGIGYKFNSYYQLPLEEIKLFELENALKKLQAQE